MKMKTVSYVFVAPLLFTIACYNTGMVTKEELKARDEPPDITVRTRDSLTYRFSKEHYSILGDTLSGSGVRLSAGIPDSVVASIALANISSIEATEFDEGKSVLLGFGLVIVATGGLILIGLASNPPGN
jgi:hypothetical protein